MGGPLRSIPTYTLSKRTGNGARHGTHASLATLGTLRGTAPPHPFRTVTLTWLIGPIRIPPDRAKFAPVYFPSRALLVPSSALSALSLLMRSPRCRAPSAKASPFGCDGEYKSNKG
jgi:hypothetical protein